MNWLDAVFFIIITFTTISGLLKGFVRSFFWLINLAVSFLVTFKTYKFLAEIFNSYFSIPQILAYIISFILIWLLCSMIISTISKQLHQLASHSFLAPLNIIGGTIFGSLNGYLVTVILSAFLMSSPLAKGALRLTLRDSLLVNFSTPLIKTVNPYIEKENRNYLRTNIKKYLLKNEPPLLEEENFDQIKKTYHRLNNELDF